MVHGSSFEAVLAEQLPGEVTAIGVTFPEQPVPFDDWLAAMERLAALKSRTERDLSIKINRCLFRLLTVSFLLFLK